ncbi:hypothetical protein DFJ73DRAFT_827092 [Zopfochytrium polystomum]|nr:hypothetical protein DFJ73DRAFT_827092 [Zopfochytrium polystomum]
MSNQSSIPLELQDIKSLPGLPKKVPRRSPREKPQPTNEARNEELDTVDDEDDPVADAAFRAHHAELVARAAQRRQAALDLLKRLEGEKQREMVAVEERGRQLADAVARKRAELREGGGQAAMWLNRMVQSKNGPAVWKRHYASVKDGQLQLFRDGEPDSPGFVIPLNDYKVVDVEEETAMRFNLAFVGNSSTHYMSALDKQSWIVAQSLFQTDG